MKMEINKRIYICKVLATLCVITAHTSIEFDTPLTNLLKQRFSAIGVIVFMVLSGYLFCKSNYRSFLKLLQNKVKTICIPWIVLGTVSYVWSNMHGFSLSGLRFIDWFRFLLGYKTYLYYIPMLLICFIVFYKAPAFLKAFAIPLTVISLELTAFGILDSVIKTLHITHYLNPFNWFGFFAGGMLLYENKGLEKLMRWYNSHYSAGIALLVCYPLVAFAVSKWIDTVSAGYFSKSGWIMESYAFVIAFLISGWKIWDNKIIYIISGYSFTIYLIHTMVLSLSAYLPFLSRMSFLIPFITLATATVAVECINFLAGRLKIQAQVQLLFGIRPARKLVTDGSKNI